MADSENNQILSNLNETTYQTEKAELDLRIEIGDSKQEEFKPRVKILKWDNEVNFSVGVIEKEGVENSFTNEDNRVIWTQDKIEAHFYPVDDLEKHPEGGFEFEVILKEKPLSNILNLSIQTKGLDFFYQPFLTEEERLLREIDRPENVEGSYAVYHKDKTGDYSKLGGKNYQAGKVFHIYRPKIIDADGKWAWGELKIDIENEILSITIPQSILDDGKYPLKIDPTFGYEANGGSTGGVLTASEGSLFTGVAGTGVSISAYLSNDDASSHNYKFGVHLHSDLSLLTNGATADGSIVGSSTAALRTQNFSSAPTFTDVEYVLSAKTNESGKGAGIKMKFDTGSTAQGHIESSSTSYASWPPNPLVVGTHNTSKYSIYATYTAGGEPSESVSPSRSPSASPSVSPSASPSVSVSRSPSASPSVSPSVSPSESPSESISPSVSVSASPSVSVSRSPSVSPSVSVSRSPSASPSISPSVSPSESPSESISPSVSISASPSVSVSVSPSASPSASPSVSVSLSPSTSPSVSSSESPSASISPSQSASVSPSVSPSQSLSVSPSVSVSVSPSASPSVSPSISSSVSIVSSYSPSVSPSVSPSISVSASPSLSPSVSVSLSPSASPSVSPSVSPSESPSESVSPSASPSVSPSISPSISPSPSEGWELYTRGDYAALPADDTNLENLFTAQEYLDVDEKDDTRVEQTATNQYTIFQFKDYVGIATDCVLEWEGQTNNPPVLSPVLLQIYNQNSSTWETVDSDDSSPIDTDFVLTASIPDLSDYKDGSLVISCRVYQQD